MTHDPIIARRHCLCRTCGARVVQTRTLRCRSWAHRQCPSCGSGRIYYGDRLVGDNALTESYLWYDKALRIPRMSIHEGVRA
jgi:hypothetical protein